MARGAAWLAAGRVVVRSIGLLSTIILARLLVPEDFGLVALATSLLFVLETLSDLRFEQAIIAQRDTSHSDLNTAWTLNLLRGAGVALLIAAAAYPYAWAMDDARLVALLLFLALMPLLDGFKNPAFVIFEKSMVFHKEFILQLSHKIAAFTVTVTLAWLIRSYWALVAGMLTGTAIRVAASYMMHPFRPRPALCGWRRLVAFSGWLMGSNVITALLQKIEFFLLGAFLPVRVVGVFHVGSEISNMASNEMVLPIKRTLFPAFSTLSAEPERQYKSFCLAIEAITAITLPLGVGLSLIAEPLVLLALGERWRETAAVIAYLGPVASIWAIAGLCDTLTLARGNTRLIFSRELIKAAYIIPSYTLATWLGGLQGFLNTAVVVVVLSLLLNLDMVRRQSGKPLLLPMRGTWRSLLACLVMAPVVWSLGSTLGKTQGIASLALHLAQLVAAGAASYLIVHFVLWHLVARPAGVERLVIRFIDARWRRPESGARS